MKGVLVLIDGLGDRPCKKLEGKTPLEAAEKPNLDWLAENSQTGLLYPLKEGATPESDKAVVSILGNKSFPARGQLEALGSGLTLMRGDLALRTNFGTIDSMKKKNVLDRRAGRNLTNKEAAILSEAISKNIKLPCKFIFKNTIQHRGILVLKGGFSDNITNTDPEYQEKNKAVDYKFKFSEPLDEEENSKYAANIVNMFLEQSYKILDEHPVNVERRKKGLFPANIIFTRDAGIEIPKLEKREKLASIVYMPLEIGISKASGMQVFSFPYPELKNYDIYKNLYEGLKKASKFAIKTLKKQGKKFNYFFIHFKETDVPGHDNFPEEKKKMIEFLDKNFFSFLRKLAKKKIKIIVTGDHSTPCELKSHSSDPLPLLFFGAGRGGLKFSEVEARKGSLGKIYGNELLAKVGFS